MNALMRNIKWTCTGLLFALTVGGPAVADDTELLLVTPSTAQDNKPNILFILDTSGSMNSLETTTQPYDSALVYGGDCDVTAVYWTDVDVLPVCASSDQYVYDAAFNCQFAVNQMTGIGSYSDTMVQYRDGGKNGNGAGPTLWQFLAPGYHTEPVECQQDSGIHGDGRSTRP